MMAVKINPKDMIKKVVNALQKTQPIDQASIQKMKEAARAAKSQTKTR